MLLLNIWNDFSSWVTNGWSDVTFWLVVGLCSIVALLGMVSFVKKSYGKDGKIKWSTLIWSIILFAIVAVVCVARYA